MTLLENTEDDDEVEIFLSRRISNKILSEKQLRQLHEIINANLLKYPKSLSLWNLKLLTIEHYPLSIDADVERELCSKVHQIENQSRNCNFV